jgi:DNA modification methylase
MKIERIKLAELRHDDQNARTHDQANLKAIAGSLEQFGQRKPIVITQDNKVVAGNGTLTAAKLIGWTEIDCVRVPADWTADQIKAYALADNRTAELAQWDEQVMAAQLLDLQEAGFDIESFGFELVNPPVDLDAIEEDEIPEDAPTRTSLGDIWRLGNHRLMCGDATNSLHLDYLIEDNKNLVGFTSPPYNAGTAASLSGNKANKNRGNLYEEFDDNQNPDEWENLCSNSLRNLLNHCDSVIYNVQLLGGNKASFFQWVNNWSNHLIDVAIWQKQKFTPHIAKNVLGSQFEFLFIFSPEINPSKAIPTANFQGTMGNVYEGNRQTKNEYSKTHGATFPLHLPSFIIDKWTTNHSIVDTFGGTGTTLIAAEHLGRKSFIMELSPKYCDVIIQRWENLTGKKAELVNASR